MSKKEKKTAKDAKLTFKNFEIKKEDWPGVVAVTAIFGLIVSVIVGSSDGITTCGSIASFALGYYVGKRG